MNRYGTLGLRDLDTLYGPLRDAHRFLEVRDPSSRRTTSENVVAALEVSAGAVAVGFVAGWTGGPDLLGTGIPLGLSAGLLGHALTLLDVVPPTWEEHVQNLSNGAIAGWAAIWALGQGAVARRDMTRDRAAGRPPLPAANPQPLAMVRGAPPMLPPAPPRRAPLNEAELQAIMTRRAA